MKKIFFAALISLLSIANSYAVTGKLEFIMDLKDEELKFIHDTTNLFVLRSVAAKNDRLQRMVYVGCYVTPLVGSKVTAGKYDIVFYEDYAIVNNKKRYYYVTKKTDLLFYRNKCEKL